MKTPIMYWDPETGIAKCVITAHDGSVHIGTAKCSPKDQDMLSEKTGCEIAEMRAQIAYLRHVRDYELKPELKALKKFLYSINQSKYFEPGDYSNQMLFRAIQRTKDELDAINNDIAGTKENLRAFMEQKGIFYQKVREMRAKNKKAEN